MEEAREGAGFGAAGARRRIWGRRRRNFLARKILSWYPARRKSARIFPTKNRPAGPGQDLPSKAHLAQPRKFSGLARKKSGKIARFFQNLRKFTAV